MSKLPPKTSRAIMALKKSKKMTEALTRMKNEKKGLAPLFKIDKQNKNILKETLGMLVSDSLDMQHNITYNSCGDPRGKDESLLRPSTHSKRAMSKYELYSNPDEISIIHPSEFDQSIELSAEDKVKYEEIRHKWALRTIMKACYRFSLKIKQRRQVMLRYFAKHYRGHINAIENAMIRYLRIKRIEARIKVQYLYNRVFVKQAIKDLADVREEVELERQRQ